MDGQIDNDNNKNKNKIIIEQNAMKEKSETNDETSNTYTKSKNMRIFAEHKNCLEKQPKLYRVKFKHDYMEWVLTV